jgi:hypothetical protein
MEARAFNWEQNQTYFLKQFFFKHQTMEKAHKPSNIFSWNNSQIAKKINNMANTNKMYIQMYSCDQCLCIVAWSCLKQWGTVTL